MEWDDAFRDFTALIRIDLGAASGLYNDVLNLVMEYVFVDADILVSFVDCMQNYASRSQIASQKFGWCKYGSTVTASSAMPDSRDRAKAQQRQKTVIYHVRKQRPKGHVPSNPTKRLAICDAGPPGGPELSGIHRVQ